MLSPFDAVAGDRPDRRCADTTAAACGALCVSVCPPACTLDRHRPSAASFRVSSLLLFLGYASDLRTRRGGTGDGCHRRLLDQASEEEALEEVEAGLVLTPTPTDSSFARLHHRASSVDSAQRPGRDLATVLVLTCVLWSTCATHGTLVGLCATRC